jgi:hypothetical protein
MELYLYFSNFQYAVLWSQGLFYAHLPAESSVIAQDKLSFLKISSALSSFFAPLICQNIGYKPL